MGKTLKKGFGIVRKLTTASQQELYGKLDEHQIGVGELRRKPPAHITIIGFMNMTKSEQQSFHAGFNVKRLEDKLEEGVTQETPRTAFSVSLGPIAAIGNLIYAEVEEDRLLQEQLKLAGQVALHGIPLQRINKRVVPPHLAIGYGQVGPIEELRERVEEALSGQLVVVQKWDVYPDRYA